MTHRRSLCQSCALEIDLGYIMRLVRDPRRRTNGAPKATKFDQDASASNDGQGKDHLVRSDDPESGKSRYRRTLSRTTSHRLLES